MRDKEIVILILYKAHAKQPFFTKDVGPKPHYIIVYVFYLYFSLYIW